MPMDKPILEKDDGSEFDKNSVMSLEELAKLFIRHSIEDRLVCEYHLCVWLTAGPTQHLWIQREVKLPKFDSAIPKKNDRHPPRRHPLRDLAKVLTTLLKHEKLKGEEPVGWCLEAHHKVTSDASRRRFPGEVLITRTPVYRVARPRTETDSLQTAS